MNRRKPHNYTYTLRRLKGCPIETELGPWEALARQARDRRPRLDEGLESLARSLEAELRAGPGPEALARGLGLGLEAAGLTLGLEAFDEQLMAAGALATGRLAQVQTGEGKTLAIALAAAFCAMRDGRVHVLTANDYLARRDAQWMGPVFRALGLSVASVIGADSPAARKEAYRARVLYLTARELGFDYLRDGQARRSADIVQTDFLSAIVDEADFILIDEARVPLVLAGMDGEGPGPATEAQAALSALRDLEAGLDYSIDPEGRRVSFSLRGRARLEESFSRLAIPGTEALRFLARAHAALHAQALLLRDRDYVVRAGGIKAVDSFTGRIAEGRQWPWGIQAALEVKEGLEPGPEGRVLASITIQHLLGLYPRLAATTATAEPAAEELHEAYGLATLIIPPVLPSRRVDWPDQVHRDRESKLAAIGRAVAEEHRKGRPVLVGTASVAESEEVAAILGGMGVPSLVLNARNDEAEAALISRAGEAGAVTISTNMAGRGTDIRLGADGRAAALGGLLVLGTARQESRRMDDQLRGRAGRQGDPGESRFFLSLEDELFKRYGVAAFLPPSCLKGPLAEDGRIEDPRAGREIRRAQAIIEGQNSRERASLRKFSLILEFDRRLVREQRRAALVEGRLPARLEEELGDPGSGASGKELRAALVQAFLARLDAAWADHLARVEDFREGMALLRYGGRDPGIEYVRTLGQAFEDLMEDVLEACARDCRALREGGDRAVGLQDLPPLPASTWTYAVEADSLPGFDLGINGMVRAFALGPLALPLLILDRIGRALGGTRSSPRA